MPGIKVHQAKSKKSKHSIRTNTRKNLTLAECASTYYRNCAQARKNSHNVHRAVITKCTESLGAAMGWLFALTSIRLCIILTNVLDSHQFYLGIRVRVHQDKTDTEQE